MSVGVTAFVIEGDFTVFTAAEVRERLLAAIVTGAGIDVDLSRVGDMDSAGIQLMQAALREAEARGCALRYAAPSDAVLDVLRLAGLYDDFFAGEHPALRKGGGRES